MSQPTSLESYRQTGPLPALHEKSFNRDNHKATETRVAVVVGTYPSPLCSPASSCVDSNTGKTLPACDGLSGGSSGPSRPARRPDCRTLTEAKSLDSIATTLYREGKPQEALVLFLEAFEIRRQLAPKSKDFACSCNNVGLVYRKLGRHLEALDMHRKGLTVQESLPERDLDLSSSYINTGLAYEALKMWKRALTMYQRNLEIQEFLDWHRLDDPVVYQDIERVCKTIWIHEELLKRLERRCNSGAS